MFRKRKRIRTRKVAYKRSVRKWTNLLSGTPAFVIGNAPSIENVDLSVLDNFFTIGINRIFYKFDPTILMWQDIELWYSEKHLIPKTDAIKYCKDKADLQGRFFHFKLKNGDYKLPESAEVLYGRGSSGPLGFQLAYILGCDPIVLLGMDCKYKNGKTDFYGKNPHHKEHTLPNCIKGLEWINKVKKNCGREVIYCSEIGCDCSNPTLILENIISSLNLNKSANREYFIKKLTGKKSKKSS